LTPFGRPGIVPVARQSEEVSQSAHDPHSEAIESDDALGIGRLAEFDPSPLQRRTPIVLNAAKLLQQAINGIHLQWAQPGDAALIDDGRRTEKLHPIVFGASSW
jgi:hypothetical protein